MVTLDEDWVIPENVHYFNRHFNPPPENSFPPTLRKARKKALDRFKLFESIEDHDLHLIDWLETASETEKHIVQEFVDKRVAIQKRNDISPLKKSFIIYSLEEALKNILCECDKLLPADLKRVFLFDEEQFTSGLLSSIADDENITPEWYQAILFHSCTDQFLHSVTDESYMAEQRGEQFVFTKNESRLKVFFKFLKLVLATVYPVVYMFIIILQILEWLFTLSLKVPKTSKSVSRMRDRIKAFRERVEYEFSTTNTLFYMQWCTNAWILFCFITYGISYFGAGLNQYDLCYCDRAEKSTSVNPGVRRTARNQNPSNYYCNQYLYDALRWLSCRDPSDLTKKAKQTQFNQDICVSAWGFGAEYPHMLLSNPDTFTRAAWQTSPSIDMLINTTDFMAGYKESHYAECYYYKEGLKVFKNFAAKTGMSDTELQFRAFNWMMADIDTNHWLIWNDTANLSIRVVMFIFVIGKLLNEITQFIEGGAQLGKHWVDKVNMIDAVQVTSTLAYLILETYRDLTRIDDFASSTFGTYEIMARTLEVVSILSTILIIMAICPKFNVYTAEINSVIDMLILGMRYLFVLMILGVGLFFIAQNLYRRSIENSRDLAIANKDYEHEKRLTIDLLHNNMDTMSRIIRMPFGLMSNEESFWYDENQRRDEQFDHTTVTALSIFWILFTMLIVIIGFNGMVAFMSANLSFGSEVDELNEQLLPSNVLRYSCSRMQPKSEYWPVPFNIFPLFVERFQPPMTYIPLRKPVSNELLRILCDVVVGYLQNKDEGMDFESSTGRSLADIVSDLEKDEKLNTPMVRRNSII